MPDPNYLDEEDYLPPMDDEDEYYGEGGQEFATPQSAFDGSSFKDPVKPKSPLLDASRLMSAEDRLAAIRGERPEAPKPKWWQRALAGAAGGAAGWLNAGGKTRPVDVTGLTQEIKAPGYREKVTKWQQSLDAATGDVAGEQRKLSALEAIQNANSNEALRTSQQKEAEARLAYQKRLMNVPAKPDKQVIDGVLYERDSASGTWKVAAGTAKPKEYTPGHGYGLDDAGKPIIPVPATPPGPTTASLAVAAANGDKAAEAALKKIQASKPVDPLVQMARQQKYDELENKNLENIGTAKTKEEAATRQRRDAEVSQLLKAKNYDSEDDVYREEGLSRLPKDTPADEAAKQTDRIRAADVHNAIKAINRKYAPQLQQAHDRFAAAGRARGVQVDDYTVDPDTLEYKPGTAPPIDSGAPKLNIQIGSTVKLKSGKTVTVKKINSNGTFEY